MIEDAKTCMKCALCKTRTQVVIGRGNPNADILFIGEAPGKNEDLKGIPFCGAAGKQLDKLLNGIGLGIEDVYIANILKCRPPENRDPNPEEIRTCTPWLKQQIQIINPKVICTLGNYSTKYILAGCDPEKMRSIQGITAIHGKPCDANIEGTIRKIVPLFHPAAMLYRPQLREDLEKDFQKVKQVVEQLGALLQKSKQAGLGDFL